MTSEGKVSDVILKHLDIGSRGYKKISCSAELSMKFFLLINVQKDPLKTVRGVDYTNSIP